MIGRTLTWPARMVTRAEGRGGRPRRRRLVALGVIVALALPAAAQAEKGDLDLVSRASGATGAKGNTPAVSPRLSGDGRFVVFTSRASNLSPDDADWVIDVFRRDVQTNANTLVSRATGASGVKANGDSSASAVSRDGRLVAFGSWATNLSPDDGDTTADVYVRDLQTNTTTLVSRASGPSGAKGNGISYAGALSDDGRFVAFVSEATNLSPDDGDTTADVYVRDLQTNATTLVSRASGAAGAKANGNAYQVAISGDGRYVAFDSQGYNLDPADPDDYTDVFVRDRQTATTMLASRPTGTGGPIRDLDSYEAAISRDGRFVAFASNAGGLHADDGEGDPDVFVRDLQTNTTTLVSRATGATGDKGNAESRGATISDGGRYVAFRSAATNLSSDDGDGTRDIFVRDLQNSTTTLVSRAGGASGAKANAESWSAALSGNGRFVAFGSWATNLHPDDRDTNSDVFRRQVRSEPLAASDTYTAAQDTPLTVAAPGVLANDSDPEGDPLSAQLVSGPAHGTLALNADGSFIYTPAPGYAGSDSFTYKVNHGADSSAATATITVTAAPAPPPAPAAPPPTTLPAPPPPPAPAVNPLCQGRPATIVGTARGDVLRGTPRADVIVALGGNDRVRGLGGNDRICAGGGADRVEGGGGADRLAGAAGKDLLLGGAGHDLLLGGAGADALRGGPGKDRLTGGRGRDRSSQ
jgi:Tol biopolymer transport system component